MRWLHALKSLLFLTCREAVALMSRAIDHGLETPDRAALRVHLSICSNCRRYYGQLTLLRRAMLLVHVYPSRPENLALSPQARARIALGLERSRGGN